MKYSILCVVILVQFVNCRPEISEKEEILRAMDINIGNFHRLKNFEKSNVLRKKIASYAHRGYTPESNLIIESVIPNWEELDMLQRLDQMNSVSYHMTCGKTSRLLRDVYRAMGWKACTYNFGFPNTEFTHELTLVSFDDQEVYLQDAHFNFTLIDDQQGLDFLDFLSKIKKDVDQENYFQFDTSSVNLLIEQMIIPDSVNCIPLFIKQEKIKDEPPNSYKFIINLPVNLYDSCYGFMTRLNQEMDTNLTFNDLFLNRISKMDGADDWERRIDQILKP